MLWQHWDTRPKIADPFDPIFADAALREFELLEKQMPGVLREVIAYAEIAGGQLTTDPYHGIFEVVQNADDLGASHVRVAVRRSPDELLLVHDGDRVALEHVLAMTYAFLSTKRNDARSKGRFGIGLKTLNQIGTRLSVHCAPYHFGIERGRLWRLEPAGPVRGFYSGGGGETLLILGTSADFDISRLVGWFERVEPSALLFLDSVRELSLVDVRSGRRQVERRLVAEPRPSTELAFRSERFGAEVVELHDAASTDTRWLRYRVEYPVPKSKLEKRAHKATGETTPLSVAVPNRLRPGTIAAGLPFPMQLEMPVCLNAQFDPDTSRAGIRELGWNEWLFARLAEAVAAVALVRFDADPGSAWLAVPRSSETDVGGQPWVSAQLEQLVGGVQERLEARLEFDVAGTRRRLSELVYEEEGLGGLLSVQDWADLAPDMAPLPPAARDRARRWRDVLEDFDDVEVVTMRDVLLYYARKQGVLDGRSPRFFVRLMAAAGGTSSEGLLANVACVVLSDDRTSPSRGSQLGLSRDFVRVEAPRQYRATTWTVLYSSPSGLRSGLASRGASPIPITSATRVSSLPSVRPEHLESFVNGFNLRRGWRSGASSRRCRTTSARAGRAAAATRLCRGRRSRRAAGPRRAWRGG